MESQTCTNQEIDIAEVYPDIKLNSQFPEIVEKFYLGDTIVAREGALGTGWCKFRDLAPLMASRGLPFGA